MSVSLCMIVRNESANLPACLQSVTGLTDEVVVVDTGSSDDTREIARRSGARVYEFEWCDDFSAARNEAVRRATCKWIFWMDADDLLPDTMRERLREVFRTLPDGNVGYLMDVHCPGPDGGPMFQVRHVRIFPRRPDIRWERRVHEQISLSLLASGGSLRRLDVSILHVGYAVPANRKSKLERNLRLLDLEGRTEDAHWFIGRAGTLIGLDRSAEALVALNLCPTDGAQGQVARQVASLKAEAWIMEGSLHDALEATRWGLGQCGRDTKLHFQEACLLAAMGFFDEAEACISMQLLVGEEHGFSNIADRSIAAFRARHLLAELLLERGQVAAAEENAREVIRVRPTYGQAWVSLAEALAMQGKSSELTSLRGHVEGAFRSEPAVVLLRAWERAADGDDSGALAALDEALVGHRDDLFLLKARALLMFRRGARGGDLRNAVTGILKVDPICPRMRAIQRRMNAGSVPSWLPRTPADTRLRPIVL